MLKAIRNTYTSLRYPYPEQYKARIEALKRLGEAEIERVVDDIISKPQSIVGQSEKMLLSDAIAQARQEERDMIEIAAPFLLFPKATPERWNGNIDSIDTITGTYTIFTGNEFELHNLRLKKCYKGGPRIVPALQQALGYHCNVTMRVDPYMTPSSRFIVILP